MDSRLGSMGLSLGLVLCLGTLSWSLNRTLAQDAANQPGTPAATPAAGQPLSQYGPAVPDHVKPQMYYRQKRRSIVQHYPYPYPSYYNNDETAGFRNPGNVGRHAEYYYPGEQFQVQGDPVRVAQFGVGGYPSRSEQLAAQQVGISRYNSIQRHIDNYAMPHYGYGFGVGGFGGFW
jgi:hypothetical protein